MSVEKYHRAEGHLDSLLDDSVLTSAAARELTSPLILLRQLGLTLANTEMSIDERKIISERMTLTTERALRMAANLSMASTQQPFLPLETINPVHVCREVIHELTPLFTAHESLITLEPRTHVPLLVGNRQLLQRILLSFGDNALHYATMERPIRMSINVHQNFVRIGVRDYGPTVPIDVWKRLEAKVSKKAASPLVSRPQTSGIGLIAARRLAEMMESSVGLIRHRDGATFYVDMHVSHQMSLL